MGKAKICKSCGRELPLDCFYKDKCAEDGYCYRCKECKKNKIRSRAIYKINNISRECTKCRKVKPLEEFYLNAQQKSGRSSICSDCLREGRPPRKQYDITEIGRVCSRCGEYKVWSSYSKNSKGVMGYSSFCKECRRESGSHPRKEFKILKDSRECTICGKIKLWDAFMCKSNGINGRDSKCKECAKLYREGHKLSIREGRQKYYKEHTKELIEKSRVYSIEHSERVRETSAKYYQDNIDTIKVNRAEYCKTHKEEIAEYTRKYMQYKRANNPEFKIICNIRDRIRDALRLTNGKKFYRTHQLLGCSPDECVRYLENNPHGYKVLDLSMHGLHIDHYIPISFFDVTDELQQLMCSHYLNLQLLPSKENYDKSNKLPKDWEERYNNISKMVLKAHPELVSIRGYGV